MKISKQELFDLGACESGLVRFIKQTNDTDEPVEVSTLVGGENTYSDLLWLAGKTLPKKRIVKFACDCALINIEMIKPYSDNYELIVEYLRNPSVDTVARAARAARDAADAAGYAADATANAADAAGYAADATANAAAAAAAAAADAAAAAVYTVRSANDVYDRYANRDAYAGYAADAAANTAAADAGAVNTLLKEMFNHD